MINRKEILEVILPILNSNHFRLMELNYLKENKNNILRIVVDKEDESPLTLDDIIFLNNLISPSLDKISSLKNSYLLDISSYGINRPLDLDHLEKYLLKTVEIHLSHPINGENNYRGVIVRKSDDILELEIAIKGRKKVLEIPIHLIDKGCLGVSFK